MAYVVQKNKSFAGAFAVVLPRQIYRGKTTVAVVYVNIVGIATYRPHIEVDLYCTVRFRPITWICQHRLSAVNG